MTPTWDPLSCKAYEVSAGNFEDIMMMGITRTVTIDEIVGRK